MIVCLIKRAGLALALSLIAGTASALPVLRADVTVTTPIVTVGDLFENAGLLAETAIFRSPAPGTTGTLSIDDLTAALRSAGIEQFETAGLNEVHVARAGRIIDMPLLNDLIGTDLAGRGILNDTMSMEIALDAPLPALASTNLEAPASLTILRYMPGSSTFSARFQVAGIDTPLDVSGQIQIMIEAPHLSRTLPQGTILGMDDITMEMVPLNYAEAAGLVSLENLIGKQLQRQVRAGVMIRPSDISEPEVIARNQAVTVILQQGALTLTTTGKALNSASMSEPVSVLNTLTNKVLQGYAAPNGTVTISAGPQRLAEL